MSQDPEDPGGRSPAVAVEDRQSVPVDGQDLVLTARTAMAALSIPAEAIVSIALVDPDEIARLKRDALGIDEPTDVLSFPIDDLADPGPGPLMLGDVVVCPAVAERQARALGRSLRSELRHLVVHAVLHLVGNDHRDAASELAMARAERRILSRLRPAS
ncbi:MAG TPA: rRNA maturation RNase YbeY [Actinomycetota bacterium]